MWRTASRVDRIRRKRLAISMACVALVTALLGWSAPSAAAGGEEAARTILEAANKHYKAGNFQKAAQMYMTAYEISKVAGYIFNAARAEQRGYRLDEAQTLYKRYLGLEKEDNRGIKRAKLHLSEIAEARTAMQSVRRRALRDAEPRKVAPSSSRIGSRAGLQAKNASDLKPAEDRKIGQSLYTKPPATAVLEENASILAWTLTGTGIVAMAAGAALLVSTMDDQEAIDNDLKTAGATEYDTGRGRVGKINFGKKVYVGLSHVDYKERQESVNTRLLAGHVLAWPGLALAGAGIWMLVSISDAPPTALVPYRDGAQLRMSWRF